MGIRERQKKDARLDLRLSADSKALLQQAAAAAGLDLSSFTLSAAIEKANEVLLASDARTMSRQQAEHFLELLDKEEPEPKLLSAVQRYQALSND